MYGKWLILPLVFFTILSTISPAARTDRPPLRKTRRVFLCLASLGVAANIYLYVSNQRQKEANQLAAERDELKRLADLKIFEERQREVAEVAQANSELMGLNEAVDKWNKMTRFLVTDIGAKLLPLFDDEEEILPLYKKDNSIENYTAAVFEKLAAPKDVLDLTREELRLLSKEAGVNLTQVRPKNFQEANSAVGLVVILVSHRCLQESNAALAKARAQIKKQNPNFKVEVADDELLEAVESTRELTRKLLIDFLRNNEIDGSLKEDR